MTGEIGQKVEVFHRVNKLKLKAAGDVDAVAGFIDPEAIKRAQKGIDDQESVYPREIEDVLKNIEAAWKRALKDKSQVKEAFGEIYHFANHVRDLASTFGFGLMQHFGTSLRDFAEKIDVGNPAHHTIVKAHLDVMRIVYDEGIKDNGGPKAEELKKIVAIAIEKFS